MPFKIEKNQNQNRSIAGFHMTSLKFKLKTIDSPDILLNDV